QILAGDLKFLPRKAVADKLVEFIKGGPESEVAVLRFDRTNPDLKDLLRAREVGIGLELEHAARKIFDVGVVAVVQSSGLAQPLVQPPILGTMLAQGGSSHGKRRPIRVTPMNVDGKPK